MKVSAVSRKDLNRIEEYINSTYDTSYFGDSYNSTLTRSGMLLINIDKFNRVFPNISDRIIYSNIIASNLSDFKDIIIEETRNLIYPNGT